MARRMHEQRYLQKAGNSQPDNKFSLIEEKVMDSVVFLSGTTRGATLEGIGRSFAAGCEAFGLKCIEISLIDEARFLPTLQTIDFSRVRMIFSWVSMGIDITLKQPDGTKFDLWQTLNIPFISVHGDSPAYFFDRHVVRDNSIISIYSFTEHLELRKRLPKINGLIGTGWATVLDEIPESKVDFNAKRKGKLLFLKNGKDPVQIRDHWTTFLPPRPLSAILEIAAQLEVDLDNPANTQIDDLVTRYFLDHGFDPEHLLKLRLLFIAQLDDYLRAVKSTRMAEALMDFPVEIRGNNWNHLDFTGRKARYIDECDYARSIGLIRNSLGTIDVSPNTVSRPHDRPMRAYGSHTLCLTNEQQFLEELPHQNRLSFRFEAGHLEQQIAYLLEHKDEALDMGVEVAATYRRKHSPEQLIQQMLDWASLVSVNNLRQRPAGMQDFVVWPPAQG
jgi:hypothetical protein